MAYLRLYSCNAKVILVKESMGYSLRHCYQRDKGLHAFPNGISPKVNAIARLKIELTDDDVVVWHINRHATEHLWYYVSYILK